MKKIIRPGDRIKQIRLDFGHSQDKMAEILGTYQANYSCIERGKQGATYDQLIALYNYSGVNIHWIVTGEGYKYIAKGRGSNEEKIKQAIDILSSIT